MLLNFSTHGHCLQAPALQIHGDRGNHPALWPSDGYHHHALTFTGYFGRRDGIVLKRFSFRPFSTIHIRTGDPTWMPDLVIYRGVLDLDRLFIAIARVEYSVALCSVVGWPVALSTI